MSIQTYNNGPLPDFLSERAYFTISEFALPREDALRYFLWCKEEGHTILGWEVWLPTVPGPTVPVNHCEGDADYCYSALLYADFSDLTGKYGMEVVINITMEERFETG
ncbi:hypothetical protein EON83_02630 [bacterium]|nr:MAG: hypothetical protein EON83_02630 [bacterium]